MTVLASRKLNHFGYLEKLFNSKFFLGFVQRGQSDHEACDVDPVVTTLTDAFFSQWFKAAKTKFYARKDELKTHRLYDVVEGLRGMGFVSVFEVLSLIADQDDRVLNLLEVPELFKKCRNAYGLGGSLVGFLDEQLRLRNLTYGLCPERARTRNCKLSGEDSTYPLNPKVLIAVATLERMIDAGNPREDLLLGNLLTYFLPRLPPPIYDSPEVRSLMARTSELTTVLEETPYAVSIFLARPDGGNVLRTIGYDFKVGGCSLGLYGSILKKYWSTPGHTPHPCLNESIMESVSSCCNVASVISKNYGLALKIMKHNMQHPEPKFHLFENTTDFAYALKNVGCNASQISRPTFGAAVIKSEFLGATEDPTQGVPMFYPMFTTSGIGYTFNSRNFFDIFRPTKNMEAFSDIMTPKKQGDLVYPRVVGPSSGLTLYLKLPPVVRRPDYDDVDDITMEPKFYISIHHPSAVPNLGVSYLEINPGMVHSIQVRPSRIGSLPEVKLLDPKKRNCLFPHEDSGMKILRNYSKSSCLFECTLTLVKEKCGCIPWDYPQLDQASLCSYLETERCAQPLMDNSSMLHDQCSCPNDCEKISYAYSMSITPIAREQVCQKQKEEMYYGTWKTPIPDPLHPFFRIFEFFFDETDIWSLNEFCQADAKNMAVVKMHLATDVVEQTTFRPRVSFIDQVASLGTLKVFFII